jgi:hypothetical protein
VAYALADAAWHTGLERNADVVTMNAYAPLFVNVNPGGRQWAVNLIGYDAATSFGSPSYYVQKMYSRNRGDVVLPAKIDGLPMLTADQIPVAVNPNPPAPRGGAAPAPATPPPPPPPVDGIYVSAPNAYRRWDSQTRQHQANHKCFRSILEWRTFGRMRPARRELGASTGFEPMKVVPKPSRQQRPHKIYA